MGPVSPSYASPHLISVTGIMHMMGYFPRNSYSRFGAGPSVNLFIPANREISFSKSPTP